MVDNFKEMMIKTLKGEDKIYVSTKDLVSALSSRLYENLERRKFVLYVSGKRIKITAGNSYLIIDDIAYQMVDVVKDLSVTGKKNARPYVIPTRIEGDFFEGGMRLSRSHQ